MTQVRIGVIGYGGIAKRLTKAVLEHPAARIVTVYDVDEAACDAAVSELGADIAKSAEDLVKRPDVDAVMVCTPPAAHLSGVLTAAATGKPIYSEKPLALNVAECDRMLTACKASGSTLFVGQVLRLLPFFWKSREIVAAGTIGKVQAVSVTRTGVSPVFHSGWRSRRADTGNMILEVHVHELDYMRSLMGEPVEVYARMSNVLGAMDYEDLAMAVIGFEGGRTGLLHANLVSPEGEYRVHIVGDHGNMLHGGFGGTLTWKDMDGVSGEAKPEDITITDGYVREMASWVDGILGVAAPLFCGEDGRVIVAMAQAMELSAREGRVVRMSELLPERM